MENEELKGKCSCGHCRDNDDHCREHEHEYGKINDNKHGQENCSCHVGHDAEMKDKTCRCGCDHDDE